MINFKNSENTYKKLDDGTYGAWIACGHGENTSPKPTAGSKVKITTKSGDIHDRVVKSIKKEYISGVIVTLEHDVDIARRAKANYAKKVAFTEDFGRPEDEDEDNVKITPKNKEHVSQKPCKHCGSYCYGDCSAND